MHIEMEDNGRHNATRIGMVRFQREFDSPFKLRDVMYVLGMNKNLVFVSMLED